jgi:hypothetical protein
MGHPDQRGHARANRAATWRAIRAARPSKHADQLLPCTQVIPLEDVMDDLPSLIELQACPRHGARHHDRAGRDALNLCKLHGDAGYAEVQAARCWVVCGRSVQPLRHAAGRELSNELAKGGAKGQPVRTAGTLVGHGQPPNFRSTYPRI